MKKIWYDEKEKVWKVQVNSNVIIGMEKLSRVNLEKLLNDPMLSVFLPYDSKDIIRKEFEELFNAEVKDA